LFCLAVFSLFATVGFVGLMMRTVRLPLMQVLLSVLLSGGFAALFAIAALYKKYIVMPVIFAVQTAGFAFVGNAYQNDVILAAKNSEIHNQLQWLGLGGILTLAAGYTLFLTFFSREGERFFRTHAEITLARELHQALVPEIHQTIGSFEIYGASVPSGEVGGDLVDLVTDGDQWTAYVADVSGHGIAPGVLMAMFKASVRSRILAGCGSDGLLTGVHQTLYPLKTSNMFVTAGFLQAHAEHLTLSLAGHPALVRLQRQSGEIREYPPADLPMGILPEQTFSSRQIECQPGDLLLLLTDGITEAANSSGTELGIDAVKSGLRQWADLPLPEVFRNLRQLALDFGKQQDDQTMLLVRRSK
jgi:sigma-B regulation protein RsbU (phosphoserine phosphatase)